MRTIDFAPYEQAVIRDRRYIHSHPELSGQEKGTADYVEKRLKALNIPLERLPNHGVIARLKGRGGGKTLLIRADMDALPVAEETGLSFRSETWGVMHACGHDGHTAMLLGAAAMLADRRDALSGDVLFCFQPAEEVCAGGSVMVAHLKKTGFPDRCIAAHLWAEIPAGCISIEPGGRMAGCDYFDIRVKGQGGHASRPDLCRDPIKPLCGIITAISAIPANRAKPIEPLVVHVGRVRAGEIRNVFPETAMCSGGIRSFSEESRTIAMETVRSVAENIARAAGTEATVDFVAGTPVVMNDEQAVSDARALVERTGLFSLTPFHPIMASEDFGMYLREAPGFMAYIGVRDEARGRVYTQHHPRFDIDEAQLVRGAAFFAQYALEYCQ